MGNFLEPEEVMALTTNPELKMLTEDQINTLYIEPAERLIDEHYNLEIDTDLRPARFSQKMEKYSSFETRFRNDYRKALITMIERMASNPHGLKSEGQSGASASYGASIPKTVTALMRRWGRPNRIYRA